VAYVWIFIANGYPAGKVKSNAVSSLADDRHRRLEACSLIL
jgi:hypothetical protein